MSKKAKIFFFESLPCKNVFAGFAVAFLAANILFLTPPLIYAGITCGIAEYSFLKIIPPYNVGNKVKAIRSNINISPYGGAVPILKKIKEYGIPQVIRSTLGVRKKQSRYGYDDVFIAWVLTALCGGTRLDHITKLKKKLSIIPGLKFPSHDTLGRVLKKLATEEKVEHSVSRNRIAKTRHTEYNDNLELNRLLIKATIRAGVLKKGVSYTLDIDATYLASVCRGAESKYNKDAKLGFSPMVCLIGEAPVYISLRKGDAGAQFMYTETLRTCLDLLAEQGIKVGRVISDAAGYNLTAMAMLMERGIKCVMRFPVHWKIENFAKILKKGEFRKTEIQTANDIWNCEIADISYPLYEVKPKKKDKNQHLNKPPMIWRLVAVRFPSKKTAKEIDNDTEALRKRMVVEKLSTLKNSGRLKQRGKKEPKKHLKNIEGYQYKFYITNDWDKSNEEIVYEYNKRGDAERKFSYMKSEFAWRLPPFMWMNENLVFLIVASLANNIFIGLRNLFRKFVPGLSKHSRLKHFQFEFVNVACMFKNDTYIYYNTDVEYELLI